MCHKAWNINELLDLSVGDVIKISSFKNKSKYLLNLDKEKKEVIKR